MKWKARHIGRKRVTAIIVTRAKDSRRLPDRLYLDHAATTPVSAAARAAFVSGLDLWANPSSPHAAGRVARAALEAARAAVAAALGWQGDVIFTSGATEAIAIALGRAKHEELRIGATEHDAVRRVARGARELRVGHDGLVEAFDGAGALAAIQHANSETGVIQRPGSFGAGLRFADAAQTAGKIDLPDTDMVAVSAHKFGGVPGVGALLVRDFTLLHPDGGQERGYRGGTENLPGILAMAAALGEARDWMEQAVASRGWLDAAIEDEGGVVIARDSERIATVASYRMPGVRAAAQLIQFDLAGIAVSAGSACSSGSLKPSHVLTAMGIPAHEAAEVIRISIGRETTRADLERLLAVWRSIAGAGRQRAA